MKKLEVEGKWQQFYQSKADAYVIPVYRREFTPVGLCAPADCGRTTCAIYRRGQI